MVYFRVDEPVFNTEPIFLLGCSAEEAEAFLLRRQMSPSIAGWLVIFGTHFLIDRYRLARYVVWAKNWLGPNCPWSECSTTGYPADRPAWLSTWLLIIADNILHVLINAIALLYL